MNSIIVEIVKLIPSFLWFCLVIVFFLLFYRPIRYELLPSLSGFKAMGVEFSFVKDSIDAAIEFGENSSQWNIEVPTMDKKGALSRAKSHLKVSRDAHFLWVDDYPENNHNERKMSHQLSVEIDFAKSTEKALEILKKHSYDLIISDMARGDEATAGLTFLKKFRKKNKTTPVIFYVGVFEPEQGVPAQAFGITNRPDELLHLILDALEREKY